MTAIHAPTTTPTDVADLRAYRAAHVALRRSAHEMAAAAPRLGLSDARHVAAFGRYWKGYRGEVLAHHGSEDHIVFPRIVERIREVAAFMDRTAADHEELDVVMDDISATLARFQPGDDPAHLTGLLRHLAEHMDEHLTLEDTEILPLIEAHYDKEAWDEVEHEVTKDLGIGAQAAFTIPFVAAAIDRADWDDMISPAPAPLKLIYHLFKGRHARLRALALNA